MADGKSIGIVFDGSFDGLLCIVHDHFYKKISPDYIVEDGEYQQTLFTEYITIPTDFEKAGVVYSAVQKKISAEAAECAYRAFLNDSPERFLFIYKYILLGFKTGAGVDNHTHENYVLQVHKMSHYTRGEAHLLTGFCRFSQTKQGILYAEISPVNNVLPIVANHFSDRLMNEQWIIRDTKRNIAAVYDGRIFVISPIPSHISAEYAPEDEKYQDLWYTFYETIAVEGRINPKLQRNLLPLRYRGNMTEFRHRDRNKVYS